MRRMIKVLGGVLLVVLVVGVFASVALAEGPMVGRGRGYRATETLGEGMRAWGNENGMRGEGTFIDEDGDGVCDVCGGEGQGAFVDEDGDGVCDLCGSESHGAFARNGNGLCDPDNADRPLDGEGNAYGRRGQGRGDCTGECEAL